MRINEHFVGTTPVSIDGLPEGKHVLRITKFGRDPVIKEVTFRDGNNPFSFELPTPRGGTLKIVSDPAGADIVIDSEPRGQTPKVITGLDPGWHSVRLSLVNYFDWSGSVNIELKKQAFLSKQLMGRTEANFLAAIKADPGKTSNHADLAHYYTTLGQWKKAEEAFANALLANLEDRSYASRLHREINKVFTGYFNYADIARGRKMLADAYVRAMKADPMTRPTMSMDYVGRATYYCRLAGLTDKSQEMLEAAIVKLQNRGNWGYSALPRPYKRGGRDRISDILRQCDARIRNNPKDFAAHFFRMAILRTQNKRSEYLKEYEILIKLAKSPKAKDVLRKELGKLKGK